MDIIQQALERFKFAQDSYSTQRLEAREDLSFVAGQQWASSPDDDDFRLTVNLLNPFLRQITAEARQANPAINVIPNGDGDEDIADARGGLIRAIEQASDSERVYQNGLWYAAAAGEGYILLDTEYCDEETFDQDLRLRGVPNPEMILIDPLHEDLTGEDADWGFVVRDISRDAYQRQFKGSKLSELLESPSWNLLSLPNDWVTDKTVRVAQYWVKEYENQKIWLILDPTTLEQRTVEEKPANDVVILKTRTVRRCLIKGYTLNATEVLETIDWPGTRLPIFKVTGDSFYVGGQKVQHGAIRMAKDPQRQYNYSVSRQTEMIDLAPKNSFVGATGQFANNSEKWANANRINYGFLDYTPTALNGQPVSPPTRVSGLDLAAFQGVSQTRTQSLEDLKLVFGLNDASLGRPGNETSGVAITNRVEQSSRSTYHYFDNLLLTIKAIGRELNALIPYFYDTDRIVRIVKPTNEDEVIAINSLTNNNRYNFTSGKYAVTVTTGPAYASKRQEAFDALSTIMTALPDTGHVIGDLVASQVDSPIAKLAAARIRATIPPEILAADGDKTDLAPKEQVQQLQQQVAQAQQQLKQAALKTQELEVENKTMKDTAALELTKADLTHKERMAQLQLDEQTAEVEARLTKLKLDLESRKLDIAEKELSIKANLALHQVNEAGRPEPIGEIDTGDIGGDTTDIGGNID